MEPVNVLRFAMTESPSRSALGALAAGLLALWPPVACRAQAAATGAIPIASDEMAITREVTIPRRRAEVFDVVAAEDVLPKVLTGYGPLPAVVATSDTTWPWDRPGSARVVHLADGSTLREQVTAYRRPGYFSYLVWAFDHPVINSLASGGRGEWIFTDVPGGTHVRWTYAFKRRSVLAGVPLWLVIHMLWRGYMDVCLANTWRLLDRHGK